MKIQMIKSIAICSAFFGYTYCFAQEYAIANIPAELSKDANAVVRKNFTQYKINSIDDVDILDTEVISVLNNAGDKYAQVKLLYDKSYRINDVKIKMYDAQGKVFNTYSKKDLIDQSHSGQSEMYGDDRVLLMKLNSIHMPFTYEIQVKASSSNTVFLPSISPFYDYNVSIENMGLEIINKSGINLRKKIQENNYAQTRIEESNNTLKVTYQNVPAIENENHSPSMSTIIPKVEFALDQFSLEGRKGSFTSWDEFGKWYNKLLEPVSQVTPEIQQEVNALNLQGTIEEKAKKLFQYMQSKTRYVFIGIGIGGWQPMSADTVRKKGYGDCKALTNYMRVLLKAAGIPSYYSIIYMDNTPKGFDVNFPKMGGNHVVLCIPTENGKLWLESTSQKIAFNHLGYSTLDRNVVMIKDDKVEIIETPKSLAEKNKEIVKINATILDNNSLEVTSNFVYEGGSYDMMTGLLYINPTQQKESFKRRYANLLMKNLEVENLDNDRDNAKLSYDFKFVAENFSKSLGEEIYFKAVPFTDYDYYVSSTERKLPLEIPFGFTEDYEIKYKIPANFKVSEVPISSNIETEYGKYSIQFSIEDNQLLVKRKFVLNKGVYKSDKIKNYADFRKKIERIDNTKILINKL